MASRRHNIPSTSKSPKVPTSRFQSPAAKQGFKEALTDRNIITDKGFDANCLQTASSGIAFVSRTIYALHCEQLCAPRGPPDYTLVREFYANLWNNTTTTIYVRGKLISMSAHTINKLFALPDIENNGYATTGATPNNADFEQVLRIVANDGFTSSRAQCPRVCKRPEAKLWFYFTRHTLMSTGHVFTVNQ